ncbi:MAG: hypothetical protein ACLFV7_15070, partial [Phycisphaerae bacterium]
DPNAAEALGALLSLNPLARPTSSAVEELAARYADTTLGGNWKVAAANSRPDVYERAKALLEVATHWREDPDAAIVANYELGILAMKEPVLQLMDGMEKPEAYLKRVCEGPVNPWQHVAEERLAMLRSMQEETPEE